jgi:shikimate dehydrogenase
MPANYLSNLVAVLGSPVAENPTCVMQQAAFDAAGLPWTYLTLEVTPDTLADAIRGIRALGFRGLNLTVPHKVAVMPLLDEIRPDAALIGAVNTVRVDKESRLIGENTDGKGFLRGIREDARLDPAGKHAVILGAGGAARAIATELALAGIGRITLVNRSVPRAEQMLKDLTSRTHVSAKFIALGSLYRIPRDADLLINATSIGLYPDIQVMPPISFDDASPKLLVCDAVPNPPETRLIREARARSLPTLTGLSMLVYQGVIGFQMWTGQTPDETAMKAALSRAFGS